MNRLSSRVQEGEGGGEVGKAQKKGGGDDGGKACRQRPYALS